MIDDVLLSRLTGVLERLEAKLCAEFAVADECGLLTTAQVAKRLGKSVRDVQRLVKRGKLRKVANLGRSARFRAVDVEKMLAGDDLPGRRRL